LPIAIDQPDSGCGLDCKLTRKVYHRRGCGSG